MMPRWSFAAIVLAGTFALAGCMGSGSGPRSGTMGDHAAGQYDGAFGASREHAFAYDGDGQRPAGAMGAGELRELVTGNTIFEGVGESTTGAMTYFDPSGEMRRVSWGGRDQSSDQGRWQITSDGRLCMDFTTSPGKSRCYTAERDGNRLVLSTLGGETTPAQIFAGNKLES